MGGVVGMIGSGISSLGGDNSVAGQIGGGVSNFGGQVFGSGGNAGMFGLGQFRTDMYTPDSRAFAPSAGENQAMAAIADRAYGRAPSAAEMQMQQGLQQAVANSNALAASQRGISPALAARYAAMNQAGMAQKAAADSAILRAQEQANAQNQLLGGYQSQRTGQMGLENLRSGNYNYAQGLNLQGYTNAAGRRADFMGGLMNSMGGGMMSGLFGGGGGGGGAMMSPMAMADGGMVDPAAFNSTPRELPNIPEPTPAYNKKSEKEGEGGNPMQGLMSLAPLLLAANEGGEVPGPMSFVGQHLQKMAKGGQVQKMAWGGIPIGAPIGSPARPQPQYAPIPKGVGPKMGNVGPQPKKIALANKPAGPAVQQGPQAPIAPYTPRAIPVGRGLWGFDNGGVVPGDAQYSGDSLKNDKVPAMLSPKEIVLPRSVTMSPNAPELAKQFVAKIKAKHKK